MHPGETEAGRSLSEHLVQPPRFTAGETEAQRQAGTDAV